MKIGLQMWRGDESPYQGKHYRLDRPLNSPQSLTRPHPPITKTCYFSFDVGEKGEKAGEVVDRLGRMAGMGFDVAIGAVANVWQVTPLEVIAAEVIPAVAGL